MFNHGFAYSLGVYLLAYCVIAPLIKRWLA